MTATTTVALSIGPRTAATSVYCAPPANIIQPPEPGSVLAPIIVAPTTWMGTASLSGANANLFTVGGVAPNLTLNVADAPLADGPYEVVITVEP